MGKLISCSTMSMPPHLTLVCTCWIDIIQFRYMLSPKARRVSLRFQEPSSDCFYTCSVILANPKFCSLQPMAGCKKGFDRYAKRCSRPHFTNLLPLNVIEALGRKGSSISLGAIVINPRCQLRKRVGLDILPNEIMQGRREEVGWWLSKMRIPRERN